MNPTFAKTLLIAGAMLVPIASFAADSDADRKQPMTFVKDSVITTKVKAKLAEEKMSSLVRIKVDTDSKGVVVLGGTTKTQEQADKAVSIARATEGVTSVTSTIVVKKDD